MYINRQMWCFDFLCFHTCALPAKIRSLRTDNNDDCFLVATNSCSHTHTTLFRDSWQLCCCCLLLYCRFWSWRWCVSTFYAEWQNHRIVTSLVDVDVKSHSQHNNKNNSNSHVNHVQNKCKILPTSMNMRMFSISDKP